MIRRTGTTAAALWLALPAASHSYSSDVSPAAFAFRAGVDGHPPRGRSGIDNHGQIRALHARTARTKKRPRLQFTLAASASSDTAPVSQMPLARLLQILDERGVRYAPDATRAQLEGLVGQSLGGKQSDTGPEQGRVPQTPSPDAIDSPGKNGKYGNVVDAVVLDEHLPQAETDARAQETYSRESSRRTGRRIPPGPEPQRRYNESRWRRRKIYSQEGNKHEEDARQRQRDYYQQQYRDGQRPRRRRSRRTGRDYEYDLYVKRDNDSDEFNLPDDRGRDGRPYYDNGMQIFLMGFYEAGKTATQLALGSVADAINPFAGRDADEGEWWYDEDNGRRVLDVDVLDFDPPPRERRRRRRRRSDGRKDDRQSYGAYPRRDGYADRSAYYRRNTPPRRAAGASRREESAGAYSARHAHSSASTGEGSNKTASSGALQLNNTRLTRREYERNGSSRPVYGLYQGEVGEGPAPDDGIPNESWDDQAEQYHRRRKQWKGRLRHKFDAALGLQSPASSSKTQSSETYYDSWKNHIEDLDDERREALRRQANAVNDASFADSKRARPPRPVGTATSSYPRNRRARMRDKAGPNEAPPTRSSASSPSRQSPRYRLDEVPFWRDGGTIASLLFDNRPAAPPTRDAKDGSRPMRRKSLEQLLQSPFGRHHTVTSLFLYVSRSALTAFGILCRWAGVRGTIPQPIVVTTVFAALVSSRGGQRAMSVAFTVLALRLLGEVIHGSLYGNEFWEDEYDSGAHGWRHRSA